ncbi:hypothetical protein QBC37DRAFT_418416 [Rhypophila decipiens]|uniref:Uncharacterized protein n=1 Tax=Rhypophila decipiens TaxID=261697 RepID=A0AAN6YFW6_9PEZI|nr:hypothetical protein QBC37DRAFT_418416 [Rhypophila decipiens]
MRTTLTTYTVLYFLSHPFHFCSILSCLISFLPPPSDGHSLRPTLTRPLLFSLLPGRAVQLWVALGIKTKCEDN